MSHPLVSLIIPTKNAAWCLMRCLESVRVQTYPAIEVIVVDNHSTDRTLEIARQFTDRVYVAGNERSAQVNEGVRRATGEFVYEIAADFTLDPDLVERAIGLISEDRYDALVTYPLAEGDHFWAKVKALERPTYIGDDLVGAARFFRRKTIETIGGFDERLVAGEDYDVHHRLIEAGFRVGKLVGSYEHHLGEARTIWEIARKHYYYGSTLLPYLRKYPGRSVRQFSPIRPAYLRHWRTFARDPLHAAGFIVYQIVKYAAASVGLITALSKRLLLGPAIEPLPNPRPWAGPEKTLVSVIVPTKDAAHTLERCLTSVRQQTYRSLELIVVDNHSMDGTVAIAERLADRVLSAGPERSAQRNAGAKASRGDYLFFIDADMQLTPDVVSGCLAMLTWEHADAVMIPEKETGHGFWDRAKTLEKVIYYGDDLIESARFFAREAFFRVNGFDETLIASEDWDLSERLRAKNGKIVRVDRVILHGAGRLTLGDILKKKYYYGRNLPRFVSKHRGRALSQLQPFRTAFWRKRRLLLRHPLLAIGIACIRLGGSLAGLTGYLVSIIAPQREKV